MTTQEYRTLIFNGFRATCDDAQTMTNQLGSHIGTNVNNSMAVQDDTGFILATPRSLYCLKSDQSIFDAGDLSRGYCKWSEINTLQDFDGTDARVVTCKQSETMNKALEFLDRFNVEHSEFRWWVIEYIWKDGHRELSRMLPIKHCIADIQRRNPKLKN